MLKEYVVRLATDLGVDEGDVYPADYFDLMGGVGFGGCVFSYIETVAYRPFRLVAIFLGHLRMNVDQTIEAPQDVALAIFPDRLNQGSDPDTRTRLLSASVKSILQSRGIPPDRKMQDTGEESAGCKMYV
jgi:uncharacterized membrane protein